MTSVTQPQPPRCDVTAAVSSIPPPADRFQDKASVFMRAEWSLNPVSAGAAWPVAFNLSVPHLLTALQVEHLPPTELVEKSVRKYKQST